MTKTLLTIVALLVSLAPARAEIIDRILATVGGALILQTDAVAAVRLGFIEPPQGVNPLQWTLDRLIERRLMLIEVDRYGPPEPEFARIDARMQAIDQRIGSGARLEEILRETGMTVDQLRLYVRDDLRIESYIQQRFGTIFQPTEDELVAYYRDNPQEFTRDGKLQSFAEARAGARAALLAQRREAAVREWVAGLRRRRALTRRDDQQGDEERTRGREQLETHRSPPLRPEQVVSEGDRLHEADPSGRDRPPRSCAGIRRKRPSSTGGRPSRLFEIRKRLRVQSPVYLMATMMNSAPFPPAFLDSCGTPRPMNCTSPRAQLVFAAGLPSIESDICDGPSAMTTWA